MAHFFPSRKIILLISPIGLGWNKFILKYKSSENTATKPRYSV